MTCDLLSHKSSPPHLIPRKMKVQIIAAVSCKPFMLAFNSGDIVDLKAELAQKLIVAKKARRIEAAAPVAPKTTKKTSSAKTTKK